MDTQTILAEYDKEIRARPFTVDPDSRFEWDGPVFRFTGIHRAHHWNGVSWSDLTEATAGEAIARQIAHFRAAGHAFEWKRFGHDTPADLDRCLEAAGLVAETEEGFAVLDLAAPVAERGPTSGIVIRKLTRPRDFDPIICLNDEVYGRPEDSTALVADLTREFERQPELLSVYAAFADETMICAGWTRQHAPTRFASLWGGATAPDWRGRGVYSAMVAARAAEARENGFRWLTVDCSPNSRPILQRLGFRLLSTITPWIWTPEAWEAQ